MSDNKYTPVIVDLFTPKAPIRHLPQVDLPVALRRTPKISGLADFLLPLKQHVEEFKDYKSQFLSKELKLKIKAQQNKEHLQRSLVKWNPETDQNITGDPYKTVFVGRLDYKVNEIELRERFGQFGEIEQIRVVRDSSTGKSRGYAFILYKTENDAKLAFQKGNRMVINDRAVVVDIERGRVVKNWKPRRLGGGLGGRKIVQKHRPAEHHEPAPKMLYPPPSSYGRGNYGYRGRGGRAPRPYGQRLPNRTPYSRPPRY
ncbi:hypothetical protein OGAPHI_005307 [Ogataea philodendri]|uniref:RRM domain-containing protein n=1 Tax=Ogataea philodendri TaxID=1378263 RepID=A0A9P8P160_9ASCO|nr:uncharacterized protein OGAPHI_005307 [Ogataea philodendri]KAH3663317.1 hypothetical protein OGAPHI_005307 [Ogataea philodendri]